MFFYSDAQRDDSGRINLAITNDSGTLNVSFKIKVKAPPASPEGPVEVVSVGKTNCTLAWKPPSDDGGSRVQGYIIEKRDCSKGKDNWVPYTDHCKVRL